MPHIPGHKSAQQQMDELLGTPTPKSAQELMDALLGTSAPKAAQQLADELLGAPSVPQVSQQLPGQPAVAPVSVSSRRGPKLTEAEFNRMREEDPEGLVRLIQEREKAQAFTGPGALGGLNNVLQAYQRDILQPLGAAATVVETPSPLGLAGVPGFTDEFAFNPEQFPTQPDFRERYQENIPLGSRILTEAVVDPLNVVPGVGFTKVPKSLGIGLEVAQQAPLFGTLRGAPRGGVKAAPQSLLTERPPTFQPAQQIGGLGGGPVQGPVIRQLGPEQIPPSVRPKSGIALGETRAIGERGLTIQRAADIQSDEVAVFTARTSNGDQWDIVLTLTGQGEPVKAVDASVLPRIVDGNFVPHQGPGTIQPLSVTRFNPSEIRGLLREVAQLFPDAESISGIRETVGRTRQDALQQLNLEQFRPKPSVRAAEGAPVGRIAELEGQIQEADDLLQQAIAEGDDFAQLNQAGLQNKLREELRLLQDAPVTRANVDIGGPASISVDPVTVGPKGIRPVANTPQEVATTRTRYADAPIGQQSSIPVPETVATPDEAQEFIAREFYDAVPDSPTDIAATAYMQTGKIDDYIERIPPSFDVAPGFADETFKEVGRVSAKMADPTRTIQAIDFGFFGKALQRGLLWPTRRTFLASLHWGDASKVDFRNILNTHNLRGRNPIRTRQLLDATGDVLEEIGTDDLLVDARLLVNQFDNLLKNFDPAERIRIVGAAKDTRKFLDDLLDVQNAARAKRGQSEIPKLQNYRPWIRNTNIWSQTGHADLPAKTISQSPIPPDFIKPDTAFNPRAQQRTGGLEGYEKVRNVEKLVLDYVESARKDIFYTNIIQNGKAHIRSLRGQQLENSAVSIEDWIMESFAGKLPSFSKGVRENVPPPLVKGALALRRSLTRAVFPLNWTWNVFVQTSSAGLTVKNYGTVSTTQGLEYLFRPSARKWVRENAYSAIIKRRGGGKAALQDVGPGVGSTDAVQRSAVETVESYANFLTNIVEDNLTGVSVRAAYHDGRRRGLSGRALTEYASEGGSKTQSMYNPEDLPGMLRAKEVGALVPFQTFAFEIMNTVRESGVGLGKIGARTQQNRLISLAHWFGAMMAFNIVGEKLNNRQPWQLSSFVPFWSVMTAGTDPSSTWNRPLPIKYSADLIKGIQDVTARGSWIRLRSWAIRYHMLGGTQIDRTLKGIEGVADGEVTDRRERRLFEVGDDKIDIFKAVTQGVYSTSEGREYIDRLNESKGPGSRITGIPTRRFFPPSTE